MPGHREILWNPGEGVGNADLNDVQRFLRAFTSDEFGARGGFGNVGGFLTGQTAGLDPRTQAAFCYGDSAAPYPATVARRVDHLGGPLIQWRTGTQTPYGNAALPSDMLEAPYALVYWLAPNEFQQTHAIGGAQPRWDVVSFVLSHTDSDVADQESRLQKQQVGPAFVISSANFIKRRKVTMSVTITQGAEAASPVLPAIPAGNVAWYAVYVPASHNAVFALDQAFSDQRVPIGMFTQDFYLAEEASLGRLINVSTFAVPAAPTIVAGGFGGVTFNANFQGIVCSPRGLQNPGACRLIGGGITCGNNASSANVTVNAYRHNAGTGGALGGGGIPAGSFGNPSAAPGATSGVQVIAMPASGSGGTTQTKWASHGMPVPYTVGAFTPSSVWGNGCGAGYAWRPERGGVAAIDTFNKLAVVVANTNSGVFGQVSMLRLYFAGMP